MVKADDQVDREDKQTTDDEPAVDEKEPGHADDHVDHGDKQTADVINITCSIAS